MDQAIDITKQTADIEEKPAKTSPPPASESTKHQSRAGKRGSKAKKHPETRHHASRFGAIETVVLKSNHTQHIHKRKTDQLLRDCYTLTVTLMNLFERDKALEMKNEIREFFTKVETDLQDDIARARYVLEENGIHAQDSFTAPLTVEIEVSNPLTRKWINLLKGFDTYQAQIETLFINDLVEWEDREQRIKNWRGRLKRLAGRLYHTASIVRKHKRELMAMAEANKKKKRKKPKAKAMKSEQSETPATGQETPAASTA